MSALEGKHQELLEEHKNTLTQQQEAAIEELKDKHNAEVEKLLKDKELQFQVHVEDMNQKTVEKMDAKQAELEAISSELSEVLVSKRLLEEKLVAAGDAQSVAEKDQDERFQDQVSKHHKELENIKQEHEESLRCLEKSLKDELEALRIVLREKEKDINEHIFQEKTLQEESHSRLQELNAKVKELEQLQQSVSQSQLENESLKETSAESSKLSGELDQCKKQLEDLARELDVVHSDCQQKEKMLQELENQLLETKKELSEKEKEREDAQNNSQQKEKLLEELDQQLQETKKELSEKEKAFTEDLNTKEEEQKRLKKQMDEEKAAHDKKKRIITDLENKLKSQDTKMEKFKVRAKEMQESFKKKLQQNEENMKKELAKKDAVLQQKEQHIQEKILEMAQKSSQGLSTAMSELQVNHKEEVEKLLDAHKHEYEEMERQLTDKFRQQEEENIEKHSVILQEKMQELEDLSQQLSRSREENEQVTCEVKDLKEELAIRETTVQKLQEELNEAAVKLESLSQGEALLKEQMESVERNLNQVMNERNSLQDKLNSVEEESREKLNVLSVKLEETEKYLGELEGSKLKESEELQNRFEETSVLLQAKEAELQQKLVMISSQMESYCKEVQSKVESGSNELYDRVERRLSELGDRLLCSHKKVWHLKNTVLTKVDRVNTLEETLHHYMEENKNLCISLEQMSAQVKAHTEHINALTLEKENLSLSIHEKIKQIEELSEANMVISDNTRTNEAHISGLESIIIDLKSKLESHMKEKEEAIDQLRQQYEEERLQSAARMKETIETLEQERKSALEQADTLRNSFSEYENKAEAKFIQNDNTIVSLQTRVGELEREMCEKNEALQSITATIDNQSISKSEMDQLLSEKEQRVGELTSELETLTSRLGDIQEQLALKTKECEQLTADLTQQHIIRERELVEQLQQVQMQCTQNGNIEQEMAEKLHALEEDNQKCKVELESQREEFERIKEEMIKSKEDTLKASEEKLLAESARKVAELKKKAEQKIGQIKKQLTSQLEEKEQSIKALRMTLEEIKSSETSGRQQIESLEERTSKLEDLIKLKEEQELHLQEILSNEKLENEKSLEEMKSVYEEKLTSFQIEAVQPEQLGITDLTLQEIEAKLREAEEQNKSLLLEIKHLKDEMQAKDEQLNKHVASIQQLQVEASAKVECSSVQQTKSVMRNDMGNHSPSEEVDGNPLESLTYKLSQVTNEKDKIHKDFNRLQKDIRLLRKEHEQEVEYMKKELLEESEKRLK